MLLALIYGGVRLQMQRDLQRRVQARLSEAAVLVEEARALEDKVEVDAGEALAAFDSIPSSPKRGRFWTTVSARRAIDGLLKQAGQKLENAIILDPGSAEASARLAAVLYEQRGVRAVAPPSRRSA
ncbi:MAG: hypothetical protein H6713_16650 [Myxococcales bacterium]|nr:hypothetical protein [Myxococcales bacterium]